MNFDDFLNELQPTIVMFDRFMIEEQFGWRVAEHCPNALRILDTEDLHFLRKVRHQQYKKGEEFSYDYGFSFDKDFRNFPCRCNSKKCCGYIVREGSRWRIKGKKKQK